MKLFEVFDLYKRFANKQSHPKLTKIHLTINDINADGAWEKDSAQV